MGMKKLKIEIFEQQDHTGLCGELRIEDKKSLIEIDIDKYDVDFIDFHTYVLKYLEEHKKRFRQRGKGGSNRR
jgi:hypothetical protein